MSIEFYYTVAASWEHREMPDVPVLLPASSYARFNLRPPRIPAHVKKIGADCGGFIATKKWGDYKYSPEQYVNWLFSFQPQWAATMDYCCEDEITGGKKGVVLLRQERTTDMAYRFWRNYRFAPWAWCPTIQGWNPEDYAYHARWMKPLIYEMRDYYRDNHDWRVGIGTLCSRASLSMILRVLHTVIHELPDIPLHLWGIKLNTLKSDAHLKNVVSVDSAAYSPGGIGRSGVEARDRRRVLEISQREYLWQVAQPEYQAKVSKALSRPKQMSFMEMC